MALIDCFDCLWSLLLQPIAFCSDNDKVQLVVKASCIAMQQGSARSWKIVCGGVEE